MVIVAGDRRLTAYGPSWVAGEGASHPSHGLVDVAARLLGCTADNCGVGGSSTPDTAALVRREAPPRSAIYVLMTGLNDARLQGCDPARLEEYESALRTLLAALRHANPEALTIAVEQPPLADYSLHTPHDQGSDQIPDAYNDRLRAIVRSHPGVALAQVEGWNAATMLATDTVHPNDLGHAHVARAVAGFRPLKRADSD